MRGLDLVMGIVLMGLCVALGVGLVTSRQQAQAQGRQIEVLEEKLTALYLAADWDVPGPFLKDGDDDEDDGKMVAAGLVKRPRVTKPAGVGEGVL